MSEQKLLSKRVQFPSTLALAETYSYEFAKQFNYSEDDRKKVEYALSVILRKFLDETIDAMITGATKGIREAAAMIQDEGYYETVKKRDTSRRARNKQWREEQEKERKEREERRQNPTYDDKCKTISSALTEMVYNKEHYHKNRDKITGIIEKDGNQILIETIKKRFRFPDIWFESFDVDEFVEGLQTKKVSEKTEDKFDNFFDKNDLLDDEAI